MKIDNTFTIGAAPDLIWESLLDVENIVPCVPGAELIETVDDRTWRGSIRVRFGPVSLTFDGEVAMVERDDVAHRVVLAARGKERKGKGAASADVSSWMEASDDGLTTVRLVTEVALTGAVAQLSRGLLPEVSRKLTEQFAECLRATIAAGQVARAESASSPVGDTVSSGTRARLTASAGKPLGGIRVGLLALWSLLKRAAARPFRRDSSQS
jgi:uncharacterized protein